MTRPSRLLTVLRAVVTALLVLSGSIAVPILCRFFYYLHISPLGLVEQTGLSADQIRQAYNEMMDFCIGRTEVFSAGVLPFSESGRDHFADVGVLFRLDLTILAGSLAAWLLLWFLGRRTRRVPARLLGHGPGFWAAVGLGAVFLIIGVLAALDFDRAFVLFHTVFFPGKTNWVFDWRTDPIILLLPQSFFRNCALLILGVLLLWCGALVALDLRTRRKHRVQST